MSELVAASKHNYVELKPQPGPQEAFLSSSADIVIYGGAAGGGKTYALLLEGIRHIDNRAFGSVLFRRESSQIANEGGPWDTAQSMYVPFVKNPDRDFVTSPKHQVRFKSGSKMTFSHMQQEKHKNQWDGSQIPLIMFDELQHFTERQFWYMLSRNRSTCGIRPYMRGTCNPDPDSFLLELLAWWIDQETGYPIDERSGIIRWFVRLDGVVYWADNKEELHEQFDEQYGVDKVQPKSLTFIGSTLEDNKALLEIDQGYAANIEAMLDYEKKRLKGNWFARPTAGELFRRSYFNVIEEEDFDPREINKIIRYWDRAATEPNETNQDPDWTAGVLLAEMISGDFVILDICRFRGVPGVVEEQIDVCVKADDDECVLGLEQEPGASGKAEVHSYQQKYEHLVELHIAPKTKSKLTCWKPVARAAKASRVSILKGPWNRAFLTEAESVTDGSQEAHDDQIDALAGAYTYLTGDDFAFASFGRG